MISALFFLFTPTQNDTIKKGICVMAISLPLHQWWYQYHSNHLPQLPINHLPLVSFTGLSEGIQSMFQDKWVIKPNRKNTITSCLLFPVCVSPFGVQDASIQICFSHHQDWTRDGVPRDAGGLEVWCGQREGKERWRLMCNTLKEEGRVLHLALSDRRPACWHGETSAAASKIQTDDSNYMLSEGLPV